jgi:Protein of unknown function (DUF1064)
MKRSPITRNKFGAVRAKSNLIDRSFDSKAEMRRANMLRLLEMAGEITDLEFQPQTYLSAAEIGYKPDFRYLENGVTIYEEVKGFETEGFLIRFKLWRHYGPGQLRVLKAKGEGFVVKTTIFPSDELR